MENLSGPPRTDAIAVDLTFGSDFDEQDPVIFPVPETNRYEPDGFRWLTWKAMKKLCYPYLVPAIQWAQESVEGDS